LIKALGDAIGKDEAVSCQNSASWHDPLTGRIAACALCNEMLFECDGNIASETKFEDLHEAFE
jgi:hypothetical protein